MMLFKNRTVSCLIDKSVDSLEKIMLDFQL